MILGEQTLLGETTLLGGGLVGPFTAQILASFTPWLAYDVNGDLYGYLVALGSMYDTVATLVSDQGFPQDSDFVPGWSILLDPFNCPGQFLPFLAQFVGVALPPGTDPDYARQQILAECGQRRGTTGTILWAIQQNMVGGNAAPSIYGLLSQRPDPTTVAAGSFYIATDANILYRLDGSGAGASWEQVAQLNERTSPSGPDGYYFTVVVDPDDVADELSLVEMVTARKPAGVQWTLLGVPGFTWAQAINEWNVDTMTWQQTQFIQP